MYGKHFQSMYTGSMVGTGPVVFAVWGYVISHTRDSLVEIHPVVLAAILGCTAKEVEDAIAVLCKEDESSRCKLQNGRRLVKEADYLYSVPSYEKYREIRNKEERKDYMKDYMRKYREQENDTANVNNCKHELAMLAHSDSDSYSETESDTKGYSSEGNNIKKIIPKERMLQKRKKQADAVEGYLTKKGRVITKEQLEWFEAFWSTFGYKRGKADAADAWYDLKITRDMMPAILRAASTEARMREMMLRQGRTPKMAQGWLSGRRFEDEFYQQPEAIHDHTRIPEPDSCIDRVKQANRVARERQRQSAHAGPRDITPIVERVTDDVVVGEADGDIWAQLDRATRGH